MIDVFNQAVVDSFLAYGNDAVKYREDVFERAPETGGSSYETMDAGCLTKTGDGSLESSQEMKYGSTKSIYCQCTLTKQDIKAVGSLPMDVSLKNTVFRVVLVTDLDREYRGIFPWALGLSEFMGDKSGAH